MDSRFVNLSKLSLSGLAAVLLFAPSCSSETVTREDRVEEADSGPPPIVVEQRGSSSAPVRYSGEEMAAGSWQFSLSVIEFDFAEGMPESARESVRVGDVLPSPPEKCLTEEDANDISQSDFFVPSPECSMFTYDITNGSIDVQAICTEGVMGGRADNVMEGVYERDRFRGTITVARIFGAGEVGRVVLAVDGHRTGDC